MNVFGLLTAILGVVGVAAGAFGAHALRGHLEAAGMVRAWDTAVFYHLLHVVALLATTAGLTTGASNRAQPWFRRASGCWFIGILLFSGSLYLLALGGPRWLGPITPFGGVSLLAGWTLVGVGFCQSSSRR